MFFLKAEYVIWAIVLIFTSIWIWKAYPHLFQKYSTKHDIPTMRGRPYVLDKINGIYGRLVGYEKLPDNKVLLKYTDGQYKYSTPVHECQLRPYKTMNAIASSAPIWEVIPFNEVMNKQTEQDIQQTVQENLEVETGIYPNPPSQDKDTHKEMNIPSDLKEFKKIAYSTIPIPTKKQLYQNPQTYGDIFEEYKRASERNKRLEKENAYLKGMEYQWKDELKEYMYKMDKVRKDQEQQQRMFRP